MRNGSIVQSGSSPNYVVAAADIGQTLTSEVFACDADECVPATSSNSIGPVDRPPSTPSSLSPANGSKLSSTPTLSSVFSDPDTGQTGHVSYSLYDDWTASLIGTGSGPTVSSGSASAWTPATLAAGDRYDWYAQAVDASGETSASTSEQQFDLPPTVPTLKSPANSATLTNATPVLSASATSKTPIYFDFQVATDSGFANVVADSGWIPTTNTWTVLPGLLNDGSTYYWRAAAADAYGVSSAWSSGQSFSIRLPKLGARDYWPMWSHGPVEVNEANGNLVLAAPGPSYPTSAGSMGASLTYNAQSSTDNGFGAGWALNVGDPGSSPPTELIDHNASGAPSPHLDAVERISADGSSDFYTHVGSSNTYLSAPGDGSELTKNPDGTWTLDDPDGAIYTFNPENSSGVATLKSAEWVDASPGKGSLTYTFSTAQPTEVKTITDDAGRTLSFAWHNASDTGTCSTGILCVTGPDSVTWTYVGNGSGGTSGQLVTVNDGTRNVLQVGYGSNGLISSVKNADDLDPSHASPNYNGNHALTVTYDTNSPARVTCVIDGPISGQAASTQPSCAGGGSASESTWSFSYHPGTIQPPTPPRSSHYGYLVRNDAPLAYYPLDETSGTSATDASGNGNTATYSGSYALGQSGALAGSGGGTSVAFSGGTVAGSVPNLNTASGAYNTVELWLKWNGTSGVMPFGFGNDYDLFFSSNGYFGFNTGNGDIYGPNSEPSANTWHYIVAEFYNGLPQTGAKLWIDGVPQTLSIKTGTPVSRTVGSSFDISGWPYNGSYRMGGSVDEVAIYGYALSAGQIAAHYAEGMHNGSADGYTTLTPPNQQGQSCPSDCYTTYYDSLGHPIETIDPLGHTTESYYNDKDQLLWSEDADGNPTDYLYGGPDGKPNGNPNIAGVLLQTVGPDPDGSGPLTRPVTTNRYDETQIGTAQTAGPPLNGLQASYYGPNNTNLTGRPAMIENDPNVDFSWPSGPPALPGVSSNYSVRWSGDLLVSSPGSYTFKTIASTTAEGTELTIDGVQAIDNWSSPAATFTSQPITLSAGLHSIVLEYYDTTATSPQIHLHWSCSGCSPAVADQVIPSTSLLPGWLNQTSTVTPAGRISFSHYANPASEQPDYSLVQVGGNNLITSYSYDTYGRITQQVMPKGNAGRTIDSQGNLQGTPDTTYATTYTYYGPSDTAAPPSAPDCAGSSVNQGEQLETATTHGDATTTYVYDASGNTLAKTNGAGTTCSQYNSEDRLTTTQAPGDAAPTTFTYDPAGAQLTASGPSGTVTTYYDEQGRLVDTVDASGAEAASTYDPDSNQLSRTAAKGSLAGNPNYTTGYTYNADDQLTGETDPAGHNYSFFYDNLGNLRGTQYPNGTFSWVDTNPDGWISDQYNRHGTITANTTPSTLPTDSSPLADFTYTYDEDGKRLSQTELSGSTNQTTTYNYDNLGRLSQVVLPNDTCRDYSYDLDSNRTQIQEAPSGCNGTFNTTASYTYDPTNQSTPGIDELTKIVAGSNTTNYAYTSDGQTSSQSTTNYTWDGWSRLKTATVGSNTITYTYDPTGALKTRTSSSPSSTLNYLLGDLFETDGSGTITTSYADGPAGDLASYNGPPTSASTPTYLYYDAHGNLAAEANSSGSQTANHIYDPYGAPTDSVPTNTTIHRFTGRWNKQYDTTTGLILMGARPYDPTTGRFLTVDPIPGGSLNNYDYAGQDPINNYDLAGTDEFAGGADGEGCICGGVDDTAAESVAPSRGPGYTVEEALRDPERTIGRTSIREAHKLFSELADHGWTVDAGRRGGDIRAYDGSGHMILLERNLASFNHPELSPFYWRVSTGRRIFRFNAP